MALGAHKLLEFEASERIPPRLDKRDTTIRLDPSGASQPLFLAFSFLASASIFFWAS